jgi:hypothetical protein
MGANCAPPGVKNAALATGLFFRPFARSPHRPGPRLNSLWAMNGSVAPVASAGAAIKSGSIQNLQHIAVTRAFVFIVFAGKLVEETELTKHRADAAHLEHQPLDRLVALRRILRDAVAGLFGQANQNRTGYEGSMTLCDIHLNPRKIYLKSTSYKKQVASNKKNPWLIFAFRGQLIQASRQQSPDCRRPTLAICRDEQATRHSCQQVFHLVLFLLGVQDFGQLAQ